jgi:radical SAM protein with 4Fe4S-binding SPASM domain
MLCFDSNKGEEDEFKKAFAELKGIEYRFSYKYDNQQEKTDHKGVAIKQGRVPCDYITNKINLYPNGDIHSCAHDFQDTVVFGNVKQEKLIKILKSKVRENMILEHKAGKFNGLCERCDYNSKIDNLNDWFVYGKFGE